jgi:hypothetical protein
MYFALWVLLIGGVLSILISNHLLEKYNTSASSVSWFARWAGIWGTMDVSAFIAAILIGLTRRTARFEKAAVPIRDKLSGTSYVILAVVFLIIVGGLGWCFYRAMTTSG